MIIIINYNYYNYIIIFSPPQQESSAYARLTEDNMRGRKDYYLVPLEPGSAMRQSEDAGYNRQVNKFSLQH